MCSPITMQTRYILLARAPSQNALIAPRTFEDRRGHCGFKLYNKKTTQPSEYPNPKHLILVLFRSSFKLCAEAFKGDVSYQDKYGVGVAIGTAFQTTRES